MGWDGMGVRRGREGKRKSGKEEVHRQRRGLLCFEMHSNLYMYRA